MTTHDTGTGPAADAVDQLSDAELGRAFWRGYQNCKGIYVPGYEDSEKAHQEALEWGIRAVRRHIAAIAAMPPPVAVSEAMVKPHIDDLAVDAFADDMKEKLAKKRAEGRGGWQNPDTCSADYLSQLLREHVEKGDPLDVGNLAMMLHIRGDRIAALGVQEAPLEEVWDDIARGVPGRYVGYTIRKRFAPDSDAVITATVRWADDADGTLWEQDADGPTIRDAIIAAVQRAKAGGE